MDNVRRPCLWALIPRRHPVVCAAASGQPLTAVSGTTRLRCRRAMRAFAVRMGEASA